MGSHLLCGAGWGVEGVRREKSSTADEGGDADGDGVGVGRGESGWRRQAGATGPRVPRAGGGGLMGGG